MVHWRPGNTGEATNVVHDYSLLQRLSGGQLPVQEKECWSHLAKKHSGLHTVAVGDGSAIPVQH